MFALRRYISRERLAFRCVQVGQISVGLLIYIIHWLFKNKNKWKCILLRLASFFHLYTKKVKCWANNTKYSSNQPSLKYIYIDNSVRNEKHTQTWVDHIEELFEENNKKLFYVNTLCVDTSWKVHRKNIDGYPTTSGLTIVGQLRHRTTRPNSLQMVRFSDLRWTSHSLLESKSDVFHLS